MHAHLYVGLYAGLHVRLHDKHDCMLVCIPLHRIATEQRNKHCAVTREMWGLSTNVLF